MTPSSGFADPAVLASAVLLAMLMGAAWRSRRSLPAVWVGAALFAAGCTLALLFGPFAWGWLGAGDVKALLVLAALWGLEAFLPALWWMLVIGGVGAVGLLAMRGELSDLLRRWGRSAWLTLASRRLHYVPAAPDTTARQGLPFALAMGLGCASYGFFGMPL